jgi:copper chaperone
VDGQKLVLRVEGMTCGHCARAVADALRAVPGVADAEVSLAEKTATVAHGDPPPSADALRAAVEGEGYRLAG